MAPSQEPLNGSDHAAQNGVKARRAAIVLFIVATFGIMAVLTFPLRGNFRLPLRLPRPLQSALSPAERLIRPIVPWLGPLPGSLTSPGQVIAGRRPISQPPPPQPGSFPPQPGPPAEEPPPPGGEDVLRDRTTLPPVPRTAAGTVRKGPPPPRPGGGTALGTAGQSPAARGHSGDAAKPGKRVKPAKHVKGKKHAKHQKRGKHAKKPKTGKSATQGNGGKKG